MKKIFLLSCLAFITNAFCQLAPGNYCGAAPHTATVNYEMPLKKANYYFSGGDVASDHVNMGYFCGAITDAKLNVHVDTTTSPNSPDATRYLCGKLRQRHHLC